MMKKLTLFLLAIVTFLGLSVQVNADVDYSISHYDGVLEIHDDNSADFIQTITYQFDSSYNGQIVTLGEAGNMPDGFSVNSQPEVSAEVNGTSREVDTRISNLGDGYEVKIYNAGSSGDTVVVTVHWQLSQLLFPYSDVVELNWVPISDWDETLHNVNFTVTTDKSTSNRQLWAHTGYLNSTTVTKTSNGYQISAKNVSGKLELHAYWDHSIFENVSLLSKNRKSAIIKQEAKIARRSQVLQVLLFYVLPAVVIVLIMGALVVFFRAFRLARRYEHFDRKIRSYEAPEDWSPLLVLKYIYDVDLQHLDTKGSSIPQKFNFETAMQATLLDLIDRKVISVDDKELFCHLDMPMMDYEAEVIDMAFGGKEKIIIDDLFADYHFDDTLLKKYKKQYKGKTLESKLNKIGNDFNRRYNAKLNSINKLVEKEVTSQNLPAIRQELSEGTKSTISLARRFLLVAMLVVTLSGVYSFMQEHWIFLIYGTLLAIVIFMLLYINRKMHYSTEHGIITAEGQQRVQAWVSFTNMMRDIDKFDKVDIQGVVVWNRILVYATLFGYAKRVQKYLDFNDIKLANESVILTNQELGYMIGMHTHQLGLASHNANMAAHFSVSSGSSGSGGGGGFSGGGGGGGGGAF